MTYKPRTSMAFNLILMLVLILTAIPISLPWAWWSPHWCLLFVIGWVLYNPNQMTLTTALFLGLLVDLGLGGIWGAHALSYLVVAYLCFQFRMRFHFYPVWQQMLFIGLFSFVDAQIIYWIHSLVGNPPLTWHYWGVVVSTSLTWPIILLIMNPRPISHI